MSKVMIQVEIDEDELWSSVFGSEFDSWGLWWIEVDYIGDTAWDKKGIVFLTCEDGNGKHIRKAVDIDDIVKALPIANGKVNMDLLDLDNYDAICGDAILQVVMLGDVVFG